MSAPDFWDDPASAQKVAQEVTGLKETVSGYEGLAGRYEELEMLWQLGMEEGDESVYPEVVEMLQGLKKDIEQLELTLMLSGEYDTNDAILTLHAGAGGTEAQDWAQMLLRTYVRCAI